MQTLFLFSCARTWRTWIEFDLMFSHILLSASCIRCQTRQTDIYSGSWCVVHRELKVQNTTKSLSHWQRVWGFAFLSFFILFWCLSSPPATVSAFSIFSKSECMSLWVWKRLISSFTLDFILSRYFCSCSLSPRNGWDSPNCPPCSEPFRFLSHPP